MPKSKLYQMILSALFAALTAVLSQFSIPLGPVPINLATFAVFCGAGLLGSKYGALSFIIWTVLGVLGLPVFSMFRGGLQHLAGPTGGYIIGYIPAAFSIGLIIEKINKDNQLHRYAIAMMAGCLIYFTMGTLWFMYATGNGLFSALALCVVPFIPGDLLKMAAAALIVKRLRPILALPNART